MGLLLDANDLGMSSRLVELVSKERTGFALMGRLCGFSSFVFIGCLWFVVVK